MLKQKAEACRPAFCLSGRYDRIQTLHKIVVRQAAAHFLKSSFLSPNRFILLYRPRG